MRPRNRGVRSDDSRQRLIDGAVESILKVGYARTTIGELVKRAGLSKGAHVYHFKSKLDLMRHTITQLFDRVNSKFDASKAAQPVSLEDVERMLQALAEITLASEGSALLEVWLASRTDSTIRRIFAKLEADNENVHYETMVRTFGAKTVDSTEIMHLLDGVIYMLRGLALQNILQKNMAQDERWLFWRKKLAADIFDCMKRGRLAKASGAHG